MIRSKQQQEIQRQADQAMEVLDVFKRLKLIKLIGPQISISHTTWSVRQSLNHNTIFSLFDKDAFFQNHQWQSGYTPV